MKQKKIGQPKVAKRKLEVIQIKEGYELSMERIAISMKNGEKNLGTAELKILRTLATAEIYEDKFQPLPVSK